MEEMSKVSSFILSFIGALLGGGLILSIHHTLQGYKTKNEHISPQYVRTFLENNTNSKNNEVNALNIKVENNHQEYVDYVCYEPVSGLSQPIITILTELNWPDKNIETFIRNNRLIFVKQQGYRYCELQHQMDKNRNLIWSRVPFLLATLPCTEFVVHMDGDAIIFNPELNFQPWVELMNSEGLDLIMSKDYITLSPVNFGVFMVRNSAWTYEALRQVYNLCACDHARIWDWPREQGVVFDWVNLHENDTLQAGKHAKIIESKGWNQHWLQQDPLSMDNFVVHFAGCCYHEDKRNDQSFDFKYNKMIEYYKQANRNEYNLTVEEDFVVKNSTCRNMLWKKLSFHADYQHQSTWGSSLLDYHLDQQGQVSQIEVSSMQCNREMKCSLGRYWDGQKGKRKSKKELEKEQKNT